ncbi:MAG: hypothetical protein GXP48_10695 [Acidobacteria bacterium]|nr:hypothetical protein [Acidobacteriota bacterium]
MLQQVKRLERERGASLVEVLVALLILMVIMVGVLALFSSALISDRSAEARSELAFKAQQVVETLRMENAIAKRSAGSLPPALSASITGQVFPISAGTSFLDLPEGPDDSYWGFWGPPTSNAPNAMGIMSKDGRYSLGYQITDGNTSGNPGMWVITVTARSRGVKGYVGAGGLKVVRYVSTIAK